MSYTDAMLSSDHILDLWMELIDAGKSDRFVDALRSMDFKKLKTLEFNYFTSDFEAPVEDPPLETTTNLAYDFETKSATYDYSED